MRIAILTEIINRKSGARAPIEIAKALAAERNKVTIIGYDRDLETEAQKELRAANVTIQLLGQNGLLASLEVSKRLKQGKFDVVSFHGTLPSFLGAKIARLPIVRTYYGTQLNPLNDKSFPKKPNFTVKALNWLANAYIKTLDSFMLRNSDRVIAISRYTQKELKNLYGISTDYVYLGAVPKSFKEHKPTTRRSTLNAKRSTTILSVSRITPYKGFHKLIEVFNRLNRKYPHIRLTIAGSSPNQNYLNYLKKIANSNVGFAIDVSDKQLLRLYRQADIYATFDQYLFFGMPILEAATLSVPTVALNRCAAPEVVNHGHTGFLAETESDFERHLEQLITKPQVRKTLGNQAAEESQRFTWQTLGKKYSQIFNPITKQSKPKKDTLIFGILLLAILLRLAFLNLHPFWFDEKASVSLASRPISSLLSAAAADTHPPAYFLLLKLWSEISSDILFLRLLSVILGVLSIALAYRVFRKLASEKTAYLTTLLFALSPLHIYYSTEIRMYALLVFETLLLIWLFLEFLHTKKNYFLFFIFLVGSIALHTHYYAALVILSLNIAFLRSRKHRPILPLWLSSQAAMTISFLPWLLYAFQVSKPGCWCFNPIIGIPATFASFAIGGMGLVTVKDVIFSGPRFSLWLSVATTAFLFYFFLTGARQQVLKKNYTALSFFFAPLVLAATVGFFSPIYSPRALIIIAPFYYLFVSLGILSMKSQKKRSSARRIALILFAGLLALQFFHPFYRKAPDSKKDLIYNAEQYTKYNKADVKNLDELL
ncbi:glycosyltransferase [Patescibacteria group bacterium]|nr:glycosyltransferase [Patescibacteria group bacterium]